jgi:hypothetical protein
MSNLKFENQQLTFTSAGWGAAQTAQFKDRVNTKVWLVQDVNGAVTVRRAPAGASS